MSGTTLSQDLRYAVRSLRKTPGFAAVAILTLAVAIGAVTTVFSVVEETLLRPLPYEDPANLMTVWETVEADGGNIWRVSPANFQDWKEQTTVFEDMALFSASSFTLTGLGDPEVLLGARASANYFRLLGVEPALGRTFTEEESRSGGPDVIVLGNGLWRSRFGGDPDVIGRSILLDGRSFAVIGVMPPGLYPTWPVAGGEITFRAGHQQYWVPAQIAPEALQNRNYSHVYGVIGRLAEGETLARARTEMRTTSRRLELEYPANEGVGAIVRPLTDEFVGSVRPALLVMLAAALFVVVIACANLASLLLARGSVRAREAAIRASLGARRSQLLRQHLTESAVLAAAGAGAGLLLALGGLRILPAFVPTDVPRLAQATLDLPALAFTALVTVGATLLFGLAPALRASRTDLQQGLKEGGRTSADAGSGGRLRSGLVVAEVGFAVVLVTAAGLLISSFSRLTSVDPGFDPEGVAAVSLELPPSSYEDASAVERFFDRLLNRTRGLPGVQAASIAYDHPLEANWLSAFAVEGRPRPEDGKYPVAQFRSVGEEYFEAVGIGLLEGRTFTAADDRGHPGVAVVNESFVRRFFPGEDPIGRRLLNSTATYIWDEELPVTFEIVGVVRDVRFKGLEEEPEAAFYLPARQLPLRSMMLLARTGSDPLQRVAELRGIVAALDPNLPIARVSTLEREYAATVAQPRFNSQVMTGFGAIALALAALGIFGLLSYAVSRRTREFGLRMTLGATAGDVLGLVLGNGLRLVGLGIVLGLAGAFALTRLMSGLLFGVSTTDPVTFAGVPMVLLTVAMLAALLPAWRASRVQPQVALESE